MHIYTTGSTTCQKFCKSCVGCKLDHVVGPGEIFVVGTLKITFLLTFLAARAYARTSRKIHSQDFGFEPNSLNLVVKIWIFFSTGTDSEVPGPRAPSVFCFCFPPPSRLLWTLGPTTHREINNTPPCPSFCYFLPKHCNSSP